MGKEVVELLAAELNVDVRNRNEANVLTALTDPSSARGRRGGHLERGFRGVRGVRNAGGVW